MFYMFFFNSKKLKIKHVLYVFLTFKNRKRIETVLKNIIQTGPNIIRSSLQVKDVIFTMSNSWLIVKQ